MWWQECPPPSPLTSGKHMNDTHFADLAAAAVAAERDMVDGYLDGFDPDSPPASGNRSLSYRHGFSNGRADRKGKPVRTAEEQRYRAEVAIAVDAAAACPFNFS